VGMSVSACVCVGGGGGGVTGRWHRESRSRCVMCGMRVRGHAAQQFRGVLVATAGRCPSDNTGAGHSAVCCLFVKRLLSPVGVIRFMFTC
jgi:hypothetical protein